MLTVVYDRWYLAQMARHRRKTPAPVLDQRRGSVAIDKREPCPRRALAAAVATDRRADVTLASLSRMVGRHDGYLARFVSHCQPLALQPDEYSRLAGVFGLDGRGLGVRDLWI